MASCATFEAPGEAIKDLLVSGRFYPDSMCLGLHCVLSRKEMAGIRPRMERWMD